MSRRAASPRWRVVGGPLGGVPPTTDLPLAAKEVSGMLSELPLMDKAFHAPHLLDRPVGDVMEAAPPMLGIGERVSDVVERLEHCSAVLVLDGGHPVGILTSQDVLTFLAVRAPP